MQQAEIRGKVKSKSEGDDNEGFFFPSRRGENTSPQMQDHEPTPSGAGTSTQCVSDQKVNGAFANTSSCAYKSKRAGWQGFCREHFCRTWREYLCHFSVFTHQFVSCFFLFRAMENPPTSAAELDSDPDSPHLDQFSLLWWSAAVSTGPVSLTAQPSAPSWRSTTWKKREACRCRSCPWLLTGITEQGNGKLSTSFLGGFRGVADFVHGKMDGMHV